MVAYSLQWTFIKVQLLVHFFADSTVHVSSLLVNWFWPLLESDTSGSSWWDRLDIRRRCFQFCSRSVTESLLYIVNLWFADFTCILCFWRLICGDSTGEDYWMLPLLPTRQWSQNMQNPKPFQPTWTVPYLAKNDSNVIQSMESLVKIVYMRS